MSLLGPKEGQRFLGGGNSEDGRQAEEARSLGDRRQACGTGAELGLGRTGEGFGEPGGDFPGSSGPGQESRFYSTCSGKGIP